ncbi:MAG: ABC transporter ATP-binding protein [Ilumatobacteraceae bacterium]|nr:ABC transporter ATP-binding protein [Ilumatobacteraceae bacterium]
MASTPPRDSHALVRLLRPHARRWAGLAALVATSSLLLLTGPLVIRRIVDRATTGATTGELQQLALLFLAIVVVGQIVEIVVVRSATVGAWRTTNQLRLDMTSHVLGLDHEFHRRHTPGELIQRVDGDVTSVSDLLGRVVPKALGAALLIAGMVVVVTVIDWRIGIGMAVYVGAAVGLVLVLRERAVAESSEELSSFARLYGGIEERLNASEDLRANGAGGHAMWRFVEESADSLDTSVRRESAFLGMWWLVRGIVVAGSVIAVVASALLVSRDMMSIGTAFLLFQYVLLIERPLDEVVHELETVQKATGAMRRVAELLDVRPTIVDTGRTSPPPGPMTIDFVQVGFDYGDDQPVLSDVTLAIGAGRSVGIVGRTGSGKTTFSRLVLRLVEASSGSVRLGGVSIERIPVPELRHRVALVPQEVELVGGTIRDNVTLFDPTPTDDEVADALRAVGLGALADGGVGRALGAGGAGLSAGEAQLLAMARVWLRNPDIVVLDEATARVDPETERRLEAAVQRLMRGRTTLIIAHRLSTLREVDDIIVFDAGQVVEHGDRDTLASDEHSRFGRLLGLALEDGDDRPERELLR